MDRSVLYISSKALKMTLDYSIKDSNLLTIDSNNQVCLRALLIQKSAKHALLACLHSFGLRALLIQKSAKLPHGKGFQPTGLRALLIQKSAKRLTRQRKQMQSLRALLIQKSAKPLRTLRFSDSV